MYIIKTPDKVVESGDKYAVELFERFNKVPMRDFPEFTDNEIDLILKYIRETNRQ